MTGILVLDITLFHIISLGLEINSCKVIRVVQLILRQDTARFVS